MKGVLVQRGQIEPFWYSFVTETAFGTVMRGERMLKPKKLGGTPGVIRTPDPLLRRQVLYPAELRAQNDNHCRRSTGGRRASTQRLSIMLHQDFLPVNSALGAETEP